MMNSQHSMQDTVQRTVDRPGPFAVRTLPLATILFGGGVLLLLWAGIGGIVHHERDRAIDQARRDTTNLALAFRAHVERTLSAIDQVMLAIEVDHARAPEVYRLPTWVETSPFLAGMAVEVALVDADGIVRTSSHDPGIGPVDVSHRPYFHHHRAPDAIQPYIGAPVRGLVSGETSIQVTRRLDRADGTFGGAIVVAIDPAYFGRVFDAIDLEHGGSLMLVGHDGVVRARRSPTGSDVGQDLSTSRTFQKMLRERRGTAIVERGADHVGRVISFQPVGPYPLTVAVGASADAALDDITGGERLLFAAGLGLSGVVLLATGFLLQQIAGRRRQEEAARKSAALLASIIEVSPAALWVKDEAGRYLIANEATAGILGLSREALIGRSLDELAPAVSAQDIIAADRAARRAPGERIAEEHQVMIDGAPRVFLTFRCAHRIMGRQLLVGSALDVTDARRTEAAMRRAAEAEAMNQVKTEFLANMSHELRTPLNAVIGYSELLALGYSASLTSGQRQYVDAIHQSGRHLLAVVNDILDLTRAEAGQMTAAVTAVDPARVLAFVEKTVRLDAEAKDIALTVDAEPAAVRADETRLRQVLLNLASNAIKFTPAGGTVRLSARAAAAAIAFEVSDTGVGMTPEQIETALLPFRQVDNSLARTHEGTGLGLPLAQKLVELMGGRLTIDSAPERGTRARFQLPTADR